MEYTVMLLVCVCVYVSELHFNGINIGECVYDDDNNGNGDGDDDGNDVNNGKQQPHIDLSTMLNLLPSFSYHYRFLHFLPLFC